MNINKSNEDFHNELEKKGSLDSQLKDGKPQTGLARLLGLAYPIIVIVSFIEVT